MADLNVVVIQGRLSRDLELRTVGGGTQVANFSIALGRKFKTSAGEERDEVSFVDCVAWGKSADTIARFFSKGKAICIRGRLQQESWEDKTTGQKKSKLGVVVEEWSFPPSPPKGESRSEPQQVNARRVSREPAGAEVLDESQPFEEADVPF